MKAIYDVNIQPKYNSGKPIAVSQVLHSDAQITLLCYPLQFLSYRKSLLYT